MNPNIDKLPVPDANPAGVNTAGGEFGGSLGVPEKAPSKEIGSVAPPQATTPIQQTAPNAGITPQANPIVSAASALTPTTTPLVSEPDEEFEKKWVNVAKEIVERTKDDPHLQSQELSKTGREYREKLQSRSSALRKG